MHFNASIFVYTENQLDPGVVYTLPAVNGVWIRLTGKIKTNSMRQKESANQQRRE
jgi:hypothetical protein